MGSKILAMINILMFLVLLTAMTATKMTVAPPGAGPTTKVSARQLPAACDVGMAR